MLNIEDSDISNKIDEIKNKLFVVNSRKSGLNGDLNVEVIMDITFNYENIVDLGAIMSKSVMAEILGNRILLEIDKNHFSKMK